MRVFVLRVWVTYTYVSRIENNAVIDTSRLELAWTIGSRIEADLFVQDWKGVRLEVCEVETTCELLS
jgi:hypothetical protein